MNVSEHSNQSVMSCIKCNSVNIYRWFCGEYTCQDCGELFGECEEPKRFRTLVTERRNGKQ